MANQHKMTVTQSTTTNRPTTAERRAAQIASLANRQAELKQEAADRRAAREQADAATPPASNPAG